MSKRIHHHFSSTLNFRLFLYTPYIYYMTSAIVCFSHRTVPPSPSPPPYQAFSVSFVTKLCYSEVQLAKLIRCYCCCYLLSVSLFGGMVKRWRASSLKMNVTMTMMKIYDVDTNRNGNNNNHHKHNNDNSNATEQQEHQWLYLVR